MSFVTRIDWVILRRLASRIALTTAIIFGMVALVESLNTWRFNHLSGVGGPLLGLAAIVGNAVAWSLSALPVTLLVGAIVGLLDLEARGEMTVIRASGMSVWRMLRAPLIATIFGIGALVVLLDTATVTAMRSLNLSLPQASRSGELWLEQRGNGEPYVMLALHPHRGGTVLENVTFFLPDSLGGPRLEAPLAELKSGAWLIPQGTRYSADNKPAPVTDLELPTDSTAGDLGARVASPSDLTIVELVRIATQRVSDPRLRSAVMMRFFDLILSPLMLAAALVIAFAFTGGYRRSNKYGATVLYGIVLGFMVYLAMEMATIAGSAGILQPAFAAFAPAFVAMIVGTTVLLFREDGRR
jgi:lipopolysaccharide export system permease protein